MLAESLARLRRPPPQRHGPKNRFNLLDQRPPRIRLRQKIRSRPELFRLVPQVAGTGRHQHHDPGVIAPADLAPVARLTVPEAPCPSSPDRFPACTLRRPSSHLAHLRPAELQSPRFRECSKSPRAQKARPQPEEVRQRGRSFANTWGGRVIHPRFPFPTTLLPAIAWPRRLSQSGALPANVSIKSDATSAR
jgi:hypothetical protein